MYANTISEIYDLVLMTLSCLFAMFVSAYCVIYIQMA